VAAKIAPYAAGERELLAELLPRLGKRDLLLLDRGYPAFWLFALRVRQGIDVCMRASVSCSPEAKAFLASGRRDAPVTLRAGAHARRHDGGYSRKTHA